MRNLKKILALVLALMMVLSVMATASALDFTDADEIKNTEAVSVMAGLGILSGNPTADGQFAFNPTGTLTRGQAAKILAYVVTGDDDYVKEVAAHLEHPFTDSVGHWAEAYIAYCYDEGLISGKNATTFDPNGTLSGYALGKLLLCAAGIGEKADYEGAGWEVNVFKALKNNNLLTNVSVSKANITRDNACQLVWNVMNWNGETSEYVVTVGDKVIYQGTDYEYATMLALIKDGAELGTVESIVGSLVDVVFGLKINETKDAFGRVTKTYTSNVEGMNVVLKNDVAPLTFVAAEAIANLADLNKALGLTGDKVLTEATGAKCYTNGVETGLAAAAGDSVEVYLNADKEIAKVIVIHETLETAVIAPAAETEGEFAGLYKWTFGAASTYAAKDAFVDGTSYLVIAKGAELLATGVPTVIANAKITKANNADVSAADYIYVGDEKLVPATGCNFVIEVVEGTPVLADFGKEYDFVLNSNGYLVSIAKHNTIVVPETKETGYAYLLAAEKLVTTNDNYDSLIAGSYTYSWNVVAVAKLALADGTVAVVNLPIVVEKNAKGETTKLTVNGEVVPHGPDYAPVDLLGTIANEGWVGYEIQKDGSYKLTNVKMDDLAEVKLEKNKALVNGKYASSTTVWTSYTFDPETKTVESNTVTGIANFDNNTHKIAVTVNAQVNPDAITSIISFGTKIAETPKPNVITEVFYKGVGDYNGAAKSYTYSFYVNGEVVDYYFKGVDASVLTNSIYELTLDTEGYVTAVATTEGVTVTTGTVDFVDATFVVIDGQVYYFDKCETYNISANATRDALKAGDTVTFQYKSGKIQVAYITVEGK